MADLKSLLLYPLPHHLVSRVVFHATRLAHPFTGALIGWFVKRYKVELSEAVEEEPAAYKTFNAFFTRALKNGARSLPTEPNAIACPADGRISALGAIESGTLIQAKMHSYSVESLLADAHLAKEFDSGSFVTVYLSPRDYHRVHMPRDAKLESMTHVPGRLFSVAPHTVNSIPSLFARNERVVAHFSTLDGALAMVMVGAINVAAIETVWAGLVTPSRKLSRKSPSHWNYNPTQDAVSSAENALHINLPDSARVFSRGDEMGRFNMGSTVILLSGKRCEFDENLTTGTPVQMGQAIGHL